MRLIVTRPIEDALPLAEKLKNAGHEPIIVPLLKITPRSSVRFPPGHFQAVCVTSANGLRCLAGDINADLPLLAVGAQSAAAARARGFRRVSIHGADVLGLAAHICGHLKPQDGPLLYISGAETSGDLQGKLKAAGFSVTRLITYDAVSQRLDEHRSDLRAGDGVMLYSPRTAKLWASEIARLKLGDVSARMKHFCLSAQVAAALPPQFPKLVAQAPDEASMLALLDLAGEQE